MSDQHPLFFIRHIAKAIDSSHPHESLKKALDEIIEEGIRTSNREGLKNFRILIDQVSSQIGPSIPIFIMIECPDRTDREVPLKKGEWVFVDDLPVGEYTIRLWSGRQIWQGRLDETWLIDKAGGEIRLAASVDLEETESAHRLDLLDGEILIEFSPGYESGTARVRWNKD